MNFILARVLNRIGILDRFNISSTVSINNEQFKIPVHNGVGFGNRGHTEPWLDKIFNQLLRGNSDYLFIDVGVNLGQTLLKVKSVQPDIMYFGIEPSPTCVNYVNALIKLNHIKNTQLICGGLADRNDIAVLEGFSNEDTRSTLKSGSLEGTGQPVKTFIPTFTLDKLSKLMNLQNRKVIIKIDVERFEYFVLAGASEFISQIKPLIICEVLPDMGKQEYIDEQAHLFQLLSNLGYVVERINANSHLTRVFSFSNNNNWQDTEYIFRYPDTFSHLTSH
ncbi:MAG: FkbM family methyltransferase [Bacteroidia bacterium]|nr:FkbM family methyltransferase [Bacteroidia bacterium]